MSATLAGDAGLLTLDGRQIERIAALRSRAKLLYTDPESCLPMLQVATPARTRWTVGQRVRDASRMLEDELAVVQAHIDVEDDWIPTIRVQFGTPIVASAFGCGVIVQENSLPCAEQGALKKAADAFALPVPALDAGWYGKIAEYTAYFRERLPAGVVIQHPDVQSAFNNAHLIRGNDILTDFFDEPDAVDALLDRVTDFMIALVPHLQGMISADREWFYDWGMLYKGQVRISACTMQLISPELYRKHVLPRDTRLMSAVGGGRMHYCGITGEVIEDFFRNPGIHAFDFDVSRHDLWRVAEIAPPQAALLVGAGPKSPLIERLLSGDWPAKRNLIINTSAASAEEGRQLLAALRRSIPYA
ncbi:MAG: uroporphyrinogen decarboxylase family protein [Capsulimonadaceae bacterium]|nr:uroporphyrinogen decarboxylase family protein [Capsulimonadaceae bacterium]